MTTSDFYTGAMAPSPRPGDRFRVACLILIGPVFAGAGCTTSNDAGPAGDPDSGASGDSGSTDTGGSTISCNMTGANTCLCIVDDPQPGQIAACGPATVQATSAERGVCCTASLLCSCSSYVCRSDPAAEFCQCGSTIDLATVTLGTPVAECPPPTAAQKCCFSKDSGSCICSRLACTEEEMQMPSCSATVAGVCTVGETIAACR